MVRIGNIYFARTILALAGFDALVLYLSISAGYYLSYANSYAVFLPFGDFWLQRLVFIVAVLIGMGIFGLYTRRFIRRRSAVPARLITAYLFAFAATAMAFYLFRIDAIFRSAFAPAAGMSFILILLSRWVAPGLISLKFWQRRLLVLGCGAKAQKIANLEAAHGGAFRVVGFVATETDRDCKINAGRIVRTNKPLPALVEDLRAEDVVIAVEDRRGAIAMEQLLECRMRGVAVRDFATFMEENTGQVELSGLTPSWLVHSNGFASNGWLRSKMKRAVDLFASFVLLVVSLPVTIPTALAIFLWDRGPVFYKQTRVGYNGKIFEIIKFRSMSVDAEKDGVARWAQAGDKRVTPIGRLIRPTRIDEIPQIINVLRGEMSFVGPRPERPCKTEEIGRELPFYKYRNYGKPGITGWAQINYPYGASLEDAENKLKFDIYYLKNYSLIMDFIILVQTIRVVLWPSGAR